MATIASLVDRVRMELGDPGRSFVWTTVASGTNRYEVPYSPIDAATLQVFIDSADVSSECEVEEHTGIITLDNTPQSGDDIRVQGVYYRYFTDAELSELTQAAVNEHLYNRTDAFGRQMTSANLPMVEEYPASLLATIKALYTLATDASFDIDIQTPDGVSIPRSQRYRQLMDMIQSRREQYDQLCQALNIGLTRIETFTFRRISKSTNRYVPVYMPQEVDDRTAPQRIYLPIPTYGGSPVPTDVAQFDHVFTQGDDYEVTIDFDFDLTGKVVTAQARLYPQAAAVAGTFAVTVVNASTGTVLLSMSPEVTKKMPLRSFWDLQVEVDGKPKTFVAGQVFVNRQITQ